jgi:precorrin-2/cobalt-factor-2 C20-methyltransferase
MTGKLIGVGVGPGDPELLTLKAVRLIQSAPVLAYTVNAEGISYARQVAAAFITAEQTELPLAFSMNSDRSLRQAARAAAAETVLQALRKGQDVVFLTEGDPLLYSTFQHLLALLPADIVVEICPGVSAVFAAAAAAHFPLALENQMMMVAPAEQALGHLAEWLADGKCLALFKVSRWLKPLADEICACVVPCRAALVERASTRAQIVLTDPEKWQDYASPYFSMVLLRGQTSAGDGD